MRDGVLTKGFVFLIIGLFIAVGFFPVIIADNQSNYDDLFQESVYKKADSTCKLNNVLISSNNSENDSHPRLTKNKDRTIVVTYEQYHNINEISIPICYSIDFGKSWNKKYDVESFETDKLISPDIIFSQNTDEFYWAATYPNNQKYSMCMARIASNIVEVGQIEIFNEIPYIPLRNPMIQYESCVGYVDNIFLTHMSIDVKGSYNVHRAPALSYYMPDWTSPSSLIWGRYFDNQARLRTAPSTNPSIATGNDFFYITTQYQNPAHKFDIVFKAFSIEHYLERGGCDLQSGETDLYADIEATPWQFYLTSDAEDPDITANGDAVVVVYIQDNHVACSYSVDDGISWYTSLIANSGNCPVVYMDEETVYCAYVSDGNVYVIESYDSGATWGIPTRLNDVDGTVSSECNSVDIIDLGVVWVDTRDGQKDIYYQTLNHSPSVPLIEGPVSGEVGKEYEYSIIATDPDDDEIVYSVDWGDGILKTYGPFGSEEQINLSNTWSEKGDYTIRVKAKDTYGGESDWATLAVTMPYSYDKSISPFFQMLFQRFPHAFPILRHLMGY